VTDASNLVYTNFILWGIVDSIIALIALHAGIDLLRGGGFGCESRAAGWRSRSLKRKYDETLPEDARDEGIVNLVSIRDSPTDANCELIET